VLDAIQYLANATKLEPQQQQASYTVELNGYRVRRQAEIRAIAEQTAKQCAHQGKKLNSNPFRQLSGVKSTFLKDFNLETFSQGKEPHRYLVVRQLQSTNG